MVAQGLTFVLENLKIGMNDLFYDCLDLESIVVHFSFRDFTVSGLLILDFLTF